MTKSSKGNNNNNSSRNDVSSSKSNSTSRALRSQNQQHKINQPLSNSIPQQGSPQQSRVQLKDKDKKAKSGKTSKK